MNKLGFLLFLFCSLHSNSQIRVTVDTLDPAEQLINTTVKIVGFRDTVINGKKATVQSVGTGFFFLFHIGNDSILAIVTANHIVAKSKTGVLKFTVISEGKPAYGKSQAITINNFSSLWLKHPSEDVAILPFLPINLSIYNKTKELIYFKNFTEKFIPTKEQSDSLVAIQEVLMIGYPKGFSDSINNVPIVRRGVTATPFFLNYNRRPRFLIDIPIYSGSSGSPIIIYDNGFYSTRNKLNSGTRIFLLGTAIESQEYVAKGKTISKEPSKVLETSTPLPFGIAIAIKSSVLLDFTSILNSKNKDAKYLQLLKSNIPGW